MTDFDSSSPLKGLYADSIWPISDGGGPRRQKAARTPGFNIESGERLAITRRALNDERWPVGVFWHGDKLLLMGSCKPWQPKSYGWVEFIDPITLESLVRSEPLECGGHNWCGGAAALANGDIYTVAGSFMHRLCADSLKVKAKLPLPIDNAHNGFLVLSDGNMITRDMQSDPNKRSWFTVITPDLAIVTQFQFVSNSVGRFSIDQTSDGDFIYATGPDSIHRLIYRNGELNLDEEWKASYKIAGEEQAFAWDSTIGDDSVWFHDMGESHGSRNMMSTYPVGSDCSYNIYDSMKMIHSAPQRVFRVSIQDPTDIDVLVPFGDAYGCVGGPPLYAQDRHILVAYDEHNGKTRAWRYHGPGNFEDLWERNYKNSNQMLYYPDTGELLMDDKSNRFDVILVDIETGEEKGRATTGAVASAAMLYSPGQGRDAYCATGILGDVIRVYVDKKE